MQFDWLETAETPDALVSSAAQRVFSKPASRLYTEYVDDPRRFGEDVLGETFTEDVVRVMESVRDNPVTIAISANATGKTHGAARIASWWYKTRRGAQVYTAAAPPEKNLKTLLWGEIGSVRDRHPDVFADDRASTLNIARGSTEFITGVTIPSSGTPAEREARFSGKHAPYLLFIIDEGDAVPPEVYRGIESCMSGGVARLLIMFNPRQESGRVAQMIERGEGNVVRLTAFNHPNVLTGEDRMPGAVDRNTTVRRIMKWSRPLAPGEKLDSECFEVPDFLVGYRAVDLSGQLLPPLPAGWRRVTEIPLYYMVLAIYPPQGSQQLISREWISAARARWDAYVAEHGARPPVGVPPTMGLDVAEFGDDSNVACFRYGGWVDYFETWKGVDPDDTAVRAAGLFLDREAERAYVDSTGVGAGVPGRMRKEKARKTYGVKVASRPTRRTELGVFYRLRDQLYWEIREWLRTDPGAMLPPDEELIEELRTPTYEIKEGAIHVMKKVDMREVLGRSPDRLDGLALTFAPESGDGGASVTSMRGEGERGRQAEQKSNPFISLR